MTAGGLRAYAVWTVIPAFAGMTEEGVPAWARWTTMPAFAGTADERDCCHSREGGNPRILLPALSLDLVHPSRMRRCGAGTVTAPGRL